MKKVIVTKHAKKRVRQRVNKKYMDVAESALMFGVNHDDLKGRLKKHIDRLSFKQYRYSANVSDYKIYNNNVFLFCGPVLITVLHLPGRYARLAQNLTKRVNHESSRKT